MSTPGQTTVTDSERTGGYAFGTFGGVFTPTILTIFGVIMFMRVGFVVGQAGVLHALAILLIAKAITLLTSLSVGAISTNTRVEGGGAYFLISRSLGAEFGGAIGVALYTAQALSVPFYLLGFVESVVLIFPHLESHFLMVSLVSATALSVIVYVGANWALRAQYVILAALAVSIVVFLAGQAVNFNTEQFSERLKPYYEDGYGFWSVFAIYFPAVTGIMAGINMSGDLRDPGRAIPRGTLAAVAVGFVVYLLQVLLIAGSQSHDQMLTASFKTLVHQAPLGLHFMVVLGMFAASLSSAMGSYVGAPRVLQALSRDGIFPWMRWFGEGVGRANEPRRALILTGGITYAVLLYAGNNTGGAAFNAVASVITMFFLYTYGMTNLAAGIEAFTQNPSFRPRFRFFHYGTALLGMAGCVWAAFQINATAAVAATIILGGLYLYVQSKGFTATFGDARRGFYYTRIRELLLKLAASPRHAKNWRPTVMVFSGNPLTRLTLVRYATWLGCDRGIVTLVEVVCGPPLEKLDERAERTEGLQAFIAHHRLAAFPEVVAAPDFDQALPLILQTYSIGPLKPNLVLLGWTSDPERAEAMGRHLQMVATMNRSMVVLADRGLPAFEGRTRRIDIWWRGQRNGSLMLILAYLLAQNPEWYGCTIRLLRVVTAESDREAAEEAMRELMSQARLDGEVKVVVSTEAFGGVLRQHSCNATCVMLGFESQMLATPMRFHELYGNLLDGLPTTLLVCSTGEADLMA